MQLNVLQNDNAWLLIFSWYRFSDISCSPATHGPFRYRNDKKNRILGTRSVCGSDARLSPRLYGRTRIQIFCKTLFFDSVFRSQDNVNETIGGNVFAVGCRLLRTVEFRIVSTRDTVLHTKPRVFIDPSKWIYLFCLLSNRVVRTCDLKSAGSRARDRVTNVRESTFLTRSTISTWSWTWRWGDAGGPSITSVFSNVWAYLNWFFFLWKRNAGAPFHSRRNNIAGSHRPYANRCRSYDLMAFLHYLSVHERDYRPLNSLYSYFILFSASR